MVFSFLSACVAWLWMFLSSFCLVFIDPKMAVWGSCVRQLNEVSGCYMPVILGAFWRAKLETAARQISGSRWCYAVPAALEGTDREDNTTSPPNSVYLDSTAAVILDERDCLGPDNVWACWNCPACLFVCLCLSNRIARVVIHTCL